MKKSIVLLAWLSVVPCFANSSLSLANRQLCDLEMILNEGFAPLKGFMGRADYDNVVESIRLADGSVWPIPITLDVSAEQAQTLTPGMTVDLKYHSDVIAQLTVTDIWKADKEKEAKYVYGTTSTDHPGVDYLFNNTQEYYVGGIVSAHKLPKLHYDFESLRRTPKELKAYFKSHGIEKVVAFQTRNPMHRAHYELTKRAAEQKKAHLLVHPVVGLTKPGDVDYITRIRCYKKIMNYYPEGIATFSLLPIAMRMAGPREALWHALIRKNYGCTHFIIGRDHAGPGPDRHGTFYDPEEYGCTHFVVGRNHVRSGLTRHGSNFYGPYEAQELVKEYANEIGITMVPFQEMVYIAEEDAYYPRDKAPEGKEILTISGTQFRKMLAEGTEVPAWFSFPEVIQELQKAYPPRLKKGITLFFTGLSGAGKSTIANALAQRLMEIQERPITLLDGDELRKHLSSELGFSKEHRSLNVKRVGYVANEITKNGGLAICSLIAPYEADREHNRKAIEKNGAYIEVYVSTPLSTCEERDIKGLYEKAREGIIPQFTGISDPYEEPESTEIIIDTTNLSVDVAIEKIVNYLKVNRYL